MATLKQVQLSQSGEPKEKRVQESSFSFPTDLNETPTQGELRYVVFRLVKKKQRRVRIDGICDGVKNPKTGRTERIYLLRGAHSIWQNELWDLLKDKEYYSKNRLSLLFEDGVCRVPVEDERMLEYARANRHNVGKNRTGSGKYDYYEYDPAEEQKSRMEAQTKRINTIISVKDMEVGKMKKLASFLGISFVDELGMPKTDEGVRSELMIKADTQWAIVNKYIDSEEVEVAYMVKRAIIDAKIDLLGQSGNAIWADGSGFIAKIPSNKKHYEYLTELAMTNSEQGKAFREKLQSIVV